MSRRRVVLGLVLVLVLLTGLFVYRAEGSKAEAGRSWQLAREARAMVREGMPLAEAELALGGSWHHTTCGLGDWDLHLFLYGSRKLDEAGIVEVHTRNIEGRPVVTSSALIENYMLQSQLGWCIARDPYFAETR